MKSVLLSVLLILLCVALTIVVPPTYATYDPNPSPMELETHISGLPGHPAIELAGYFWVDFISADTESALLQRGGACPTPCNTGGEGEGYTQFIGYGDTHAECWADAAQYQQEHMTEQQREILWASTGPCRAPEIGQTACVWYCCQPVPSVQYLGWRHWDYIEE